MIDGHVLESAWEQSQIANLQSAICNLLLEIPAPRLFPLDRFEERLEIAFSEALRALPLDDLVEERRPVLHGFREDLEQVTLIVAIHEYAELAERLEVFIDRPDAIEQRVVIARRHAQEFDSTI